MAVADEVNRGRGPELTLTATERLTMDGLRRLIGLTFTMSRTSGNSTLHVHTTIADACRFDEDGKTAHLVSPAHYRSLTDYPVATDLATARDLGDDGDPAALDLLAWVTTFSSGRQLSARATWAHLHEQLGGHAATVDEFRDVAAPILRQILGATNLRSLLTDTDIVLDRRSPRR